MENDNEREKNTSLSSARISAQQDKKSSSEKTVDSETVQQKKKEAHAGDYFNRVILVQAAVCALLILLTVITAKINPAAFEAIKAGYNEIMSEDMSTEEIIDTLKKAADRPSEKKNEKEPYFYDNTDEKYGDAPEDYGDREQEYEHNGAGGEDAEGGRSSVAVMATLSSMGEDDKITVPLHGRITSKYGYRKNPVSGAYALHTGLDIGADEGDDIVAAYNGVVKDTGYGDKKGLYVLMLHENGIETLYCHCSQILAEEGAVIRAGEAIALVGSTGWSTGPHLHFEIHENGNTVDPLTVLEEKDGRV